MKNNVCYRREFSTTITAIRPPLWQEPGERGFSLVEILVSLAVLGIATVVMTTSMVNLYRSAKRVENKAASVGIDVSLQSYLTSRPVCSGAIDKNILIAGNSPADLSLAFSLPGVGEIRPGTSNSILDVTTNVLALRKIALADTNNLGMRIYVGILSSAFSAQNVDHVDQFNENPVGGLSVMVDAGGRILSCVLGPMSFSTPGTTPQPPIVCTNCGGSSSGGGSSSSSGSGSSSSGGSSSSSSSSGGSSSGGASSSSGGASSSGGGDKYAIGVEATPAVCNSVSSCAVYDWFYRNMPAGTNFTAQAEQWMQSNSNWESIATSYVSSMSGLQQLNMLAQVNQLPNMGVPLPYGSGGGSTAVTHNGGDTIDIWVSDTVTKDPSGLSMLKTADGVKVLQNLFDDPNSTSATKLSQSIFRNAITEAPSTLMDSNLGLGLWMSALGYASTEEFVNGVPGGAMALTKNADFIAAAKPGTPEYQALNAIIDYVQEHPTQAAMIAQGTGLWGQNWSDGALGVQRFIIDQIRTNGDVSVALDIAQGTALWAQNWEGGRAGVMAAISSDPGFSAQVAHGTGLWANNWSGGTQGVANAIATNAQYSANVAQGTSLWASSWSGGESGVASVIQSNSGYAAQVAEGTSYWVNNWSAGSSGVQSAISSDASSSAQIAQGTSIAVQVFGESAVSSAISSNASASAQIASDLASFASSSGWSTSQMQDYVAANPDTWQADLAAAVGR